MAGGTPAITGVQLIKLLVLDDWRERRRSTHGIALQKDFGNGDIRTTTVQPRTDSMPPGTLGCILSVRQTGIGRPGLTKLIKKYGLP